MGAANLVILVSQPSSYFCLFLILTGSRTPQPSSHRLPSLCGQVTGRPVAPKVSPYRAVATRLDALLPRGQHDRGHCRLGTCSECFGKVERETGIEPVTSSLGSWRSTAELLPLNFR